jgi:transcription initiation factor TFIID subunit TAF12
MRSILVAVGLACALGAAPAAAQSATTKPASDTGCTQPLDVCTKERTGALKTQARRLTAAARMKPTTTLTAEERAKVQGYDRWLRTQSQHVRELAERGTAATTGEIQTAFNREYMQLQQRMQREHRQFEDISNIIQAKHDAVKNAIDGAR